MTFFPSQIIFILLYKQYLLVLLFAIYERCSMRLIMSKIMKYYNNII